MTVEEEYIPDALLLLQSAMVIQTILYNK